MKTSCKSKPRSSVQVVDRNRLACLICQSRFWEHKGLDVLWWNITTVPRFHNSETVVFCRQVRTILLETAGFAKHSNRMYRTKRHFVRSKTKKQISNKFDYLNEIISMRLILCGTWLIRRPQPPSPQLEWLRQRGICCMFPQDTIPLMTDAPS